ncbi:MAG: hypothetical protein OHK0022_27070 [Roseiflexaceae bacterium]
MVRWIGIGLAVVGIITIAFIVTAAIYPGFREASRDIAIVILAVFQMIGAILTIALLLAVLYAVNVVRTTANRLQTLAQTNVLPKIDALQVKLDQVIDTTQSITNNVKDTTTTVSTTTNYVAEQVVAPVIRVSGLMAGVRAAATFLARRGAPPEA